MKFLKPCNLIQLHYLLCSCFTPQKSKIFLASKITDPKLRAQFSDTSSIKQGSEKRVLFYLIKDIEQYF